MLWRMPAGLQSGRIGIMFIFFRTAGACPERSRRIPPAHERGPEARGPNMHARSECMHCQQRASFCATGCAETPAEGLGHWRKRRKGGNLNATVTMPALPARAEPVRYALHAHAAARCVKIEMVEMGSANCANCANCANPRNRSPLGAGPGAPGGREGEQQRE